MGLLSLAIIAIFFYVVAWLLQLRVLRLRLLSQQCAVLGFSFIAIIVHAYLLHHWIDVHKLQNLNIFNMLSLDIWLVCVLLFVVALFRPVHALIIILFPIAILSIILVLWFPSFLIVNTAAEPRVLCHIIFSVFTFSLLCLAGLQAILLAVQERLLCLGSWRLIENLPPLQTSERLLFQILGISFVLLTGLLFSSIYSFHALLWQHWFLVQKMVLAIIAWIIIGVLLWGRYFFGWRGRKAIYSTLFSLLLILIVSLGSEILLKG